MVLRRHWLYGLAFLGWSASPHVHAQTPRAFPTKPVRTVVPVT